MKQRSYAFFICILLLAAHAFAQPQSNNWQATVTETVKIKEPEKVFYKNVTFQNGARTFTAQFVSFAAGSYRAALADQPSNDAAKFSSVAKLTAEHGAIVGVNGGFFTKEFTPNGLCVIEGRSISTIKKLSSPVLAGILSIDDKGVVNLQPTVAYRGQGETKSALQAGPLLIGADGKLSAEMIAQGFIARQETKHTVIALAADQRLLVISTSAISLTDFADCLLNHADAFGVKQIAAALSLDGGRSAALTVRLPERMINLAEGWPVRNAFVVSLL